MKRGIAPARNHPPEASSDEGARMYIGVGALVVLLLVVIIVLLSRR